MAIDLIFTSNELFKDFILPFLLVFALIFAILEKTKLLGDGKHQINAIVSLVIGLIFISFSYAKNVAINMVSFMSVVLIIIFVFMLLFGFLSGKTKEEKTLNKGLIIALGIIVGIATIIAILVFTGLGDIVVNYFKNNPNARSTLLNIIFILLVGGGIATIVSMGNKESKSSS